MKTNKFNFIKSDKSKSFSAKELEINTNKKQTNLT